MTGVLKSIDGLLRGEFTKAEDLRSGQITISTGTLLMAVLLLGAFYGVFMGLYSGLRPDGEGLPQLMASAIKVPSLFLLTLLVTMPSLYVFSAMAGSSLPFEATLRLMLSAITVNLALLASLGPVVGFFTLSSDSYDFMIVLNVALFTISGFIGLAFLRRAVEHLFGERQSLADAIQAVTETKESASEASPPPEGRAPESPTAPLVQDAASTYIPPVSPIPGLSIEQSAEPEGRSPAEYEQSLSSKPIVVKVSPKSAAREADDTSRLIFRVWLFTYCIVGAQMGWILRPFIGAPDQPFQIFRPRESNFFAAFFETLGRLLGLA